jgi:hypothetical protein
LKSTEARLAERRDAIVGGVVVLVGLGLVLATHVARSVAHPSGLVVSVVLGSLPNFGAGLALPFVVTNAQQFLGLRVWLGTLRFCILCAGAFVALTLWEYVQLVAWRYQFDMNDVVASGVGAVLAALVSVWLRPQRASRASRVSAPGGGGDTA